MEYGAGIIAAEQCNCNFSDIIPYLNGSIIDIFKKYPHINDVIPAVGYGDQQLADLEDIINAVPCDAVVIATPIDLPKLISINKPYTRVRYNIEDDGKIEDVINKFITMDLGKMIKNVL